LGGSRRRERFDEGAEGDGSLRLCAATRLARPPEELIRFVAGPDGAIVPDLARKLPGRGVWVTAERQLVEQAIRTRAFARSLKRQVQVSQDLGGLVDRLLRDRVGALLSLANKAGLVVIGFAKIDAALEAGTVAALLHGSDASRDGCDKLDRKFRAISAAAGRTAAILTPFTVDEMSLAIGRPNVVHAALIPGGATDRFLSEAERLGRYRSGSGTSGPGADGHGPSGHAAVSPNDLV